jgi:hypothetical protein
MVTTITQEKMSNPSTSTDMLTQNSKMKKTSQEMGVKLVNFNIPAFEDPQTGKRTCPWAGDCAALCYARKGRYRFGNVQSSLAKKYYATKQDDFVDIMIGHIEKSKADYVRIHDAGDYYSPEYVDKWMAIIHHFRGEKRLYSYTKSLPFFMERDLPENFDVIYSMGGKLDHLIDVEKHRHSKMYDTYEQMEADNYVNASFNDLMATRWF